MNIDVVDWLEMKSCGLAVNLVFREVLHKMLDPSSSIKIGQISFGPDHATSNQQGNNNCLDRLIKMMRHPALVDTHG